MQNIPLDNYYTAIIESAEKTCAVSANENPSQIVGALGTKLAMILKASREVNSHGCLCAQIESICRALVKP